MSMLPIDRKFTFTARCQAHDHAHTENDAVVFLAKDKHLAKTLMYYLLLCESDPEVKREQVVGVKLLIERVNEYQRTHPTKAPDVDLGEEEAVVNAPN